MMIIYIYGTNESVSKDKFWKVGGERITLNYAETFHNNYQYIDDVVSYN